jgi:hypothetical protein
MNRTPLIHLVAAAGLCAASHAQDVVTTFPDRPLPVPDHQAKPFGAEARLQNVNVSNLVGDEAEVTIDVNPTDPDNQVVVGYSPSRVPMNTFFTMDRGLTWTLVPIGDADDGLSPFLRGDPTVAFGASGDVYVGYGAWQSFPHQIKVVVARSIDGGQS